MTVYIVQEVRGRDISSASSYGNLEILLTSDQIIVDAEGNFDGEMKCEELIVSGTVNGNITVKSLIIMENGKISGKIAYNQLAVFEGGIIDVAGMKPKSDISDDEKVIDISKKSNFDS